MVTPSIGAVVLVPFPFSDISNAKLRPAFVVADVGGHDWICVQITSNPYSDIAAIEIKDSDFKTGSLKRISYVRPGKLFTANRMIFKKKVGVLKSKKTDQIKNFIIKIVKGNSKP